MTSKEFFVLKDGDIVQDIQHDAYVAIGNFDGLHRGHQYLIRCMEDLARCSKKPATVLTFEPHPRQFFNPTNSFFRLTTVSAKEIILRKLGIDGIFVRAFNLDLSRKTAAEFIAMLRHDLRVRGVVVGHDFHFGRNREGTPAWLKELCAENDMDYAIVDPFSCGDEIVSSSLIRHALHEGDVAKANHLLGYRWFVQAVVVHGAKRGRELGYPTANLELDPGCGLRHGVYSVRARLPNGMIGGGVASFGRRPMFDNGAPLLEINIFDYSGNLYDQSLAVEIVGWIREERRFATLPELIAAMDKDAETARQQVKQATGLSMLD